ncbi:hypothetical protein M0813_09017 [Anaeramoeba flamelloides]|uniref:Uncharacterized protein n=1 Tax=Anaeramoeba flamelloides TaxID=1746091 RepID=A0ABQ8X6A0_9EUKA|nr:hypothetical protein M0813_09017 [Anaeramoeba flamelloides]
MMVTNLEKLQLMDYTLGDTPAQLEARGRKSHRCLQNCATCTLTMGQPEYQEDLTNVKRRKPNETKIYQNEFKNLFKQ